MIYLDNNATTRPDGRVLDRVREVAAECFGNPGSPHAAGRRARRVLEESRELVADRLNAPVDGVVFTSGATEASNLALFGLARRPAAVVSTAGEHPASEEVLSRLQADGWSRVRLPITADGRPGPPDSLPDDAWEDVRLLTVTLAHNETGVITDAAPLRAACDRRRIPWHLDGTQAVGKIPVDFGALGCTTLSFAAHKFHGPRGIGCLLVRSGVRLHPRSVGGHQESGRRAGTEAVSLAAGLAEAVRLTTDELEAAGRRVASLRERLESGLRALDASVVIHGHASPRLPGTSCVGFPGRDGQALVVALDLAGVCCSTGSACASGSPEPSPVLLAMGMPEALARASVRFSLAGDTTDEDVNAALRTLARVMRTPPGV